MNTHLFNILYHEMGSTLLNTSAMDPNDDDCPKKKRWCCWWWAELARFFMEHHFFFFFWYKNHVLFPPSQNRVAVLQEQNQIKDIKRKSHHLYWNTTVLRIQVFCTIITSIVKIFPPGSFKFESDHIKDLIIIFYLK